MKNLLSLFILFTFLTCTINANSQVKVYETYEEYTSGGGTEYDEFSDFTESTVMFKKGNEETTFKCKNIWGFTTGEEIWRCLNYGGMVPSFVKLIAFTDDFYYFEYGVFHAALKLKRDSYLYTLVQCHVSNSLNGEAVRVWLKGGMRSKLKKFGEANPSSKSVIDCWLARDVKNQCTIDQARPCVYDFFGIEEE